MTGRSSAAADSSSRSDADPGAPGSAPVFVLDNVDEPARQRAERMIATVIAKAPRPVIFSRVKLRVNDARDPDQRAVAQATLDVSGSLIRSEAAAPTAAEAVDAIQARLDRRLRRLADRRRDAQERPPATPPGEWRHGDLPTRRPDFFPRPAEDREVVRRKAFAPEATSIEDAVFDMEVLDHRFFLFTDEDDDEDAIVFETNDGVVLRRLGGGHPAGEGSRPLPVTVDPEPPSTIEVDDATDQLDAADAAFLFFRNAETGRGAVLYRRYDGHYGLIEPRV